MFSSTSSGISSHGSSSSSIASSTLGTSTSLESIILFSIVIESKYSKISLISSLVLDNTFSSFTLSLIIVPKRFIKSSQVSTSSWVIFLKSVLLLKSIILFSISVAFLLSGNFSLIALSYSSIKLNILLAYFYFLNHL